MLYKNIPVNTNENRELGTKLRVFRKRKLLLTQEQLAKELAIAQENISKAENGTNPAGLLEKISNHFKIAKTEVEDIDTEQLINVYGNIETNYGTQNNYYNGENSLEEIRDSMKLLVKAMEKIIDEKQIIHKNKKASV